MKIKTGLLLLTLWVYMAFFTMTAAAAQRIEGVHLEISYGTEVPKEGEGIGQLWVTTANTECTVVHTAYLNEQSVWSLDDVPGVLVILEAQEGYSFAYETLQGISFSGCGAVLLRGAKRDDGRYLELYVQLEPVSIGRERIKGEPEEEKQPDTKEVMESYLVPMTWWKDKEARWADSGADLYMVELYRNGKKDDTVMTDGISYDFRQQMARKGEYRFRVCAVLTELGRNGPWSPYSESYYLDRGINEGLLPVNEGTAEGGPSEVGASVEVPGTIVEKEKKASGPGRTLR